MRARTSIAALSLSGLVLLVACNWKWDPDKAPEGFGIVREHVISAPHNIPPIRSEWNYTIIDIDGRPVVRETYPPWIDLQAGALVSVGTHHFRGRVAPNLLPRDYKPHEVSFDGNVASGKVYFVVGQENEASLVESHAAR
jgi:hypothetical protein